MAGLAELGGIVGFYAAGAAEITVTAGGSLVVPSVMLVTRLTDVRDL